MPAAKTVHVSVPISTEVTGANPDCRISGAYEDGALVITIDPRKQNVHQRLGLSTRTKLHFTGRNEYFVQELSGMLWPIRYRVLTREGYYLGPNGRRIHVTTAAEGLDARRGAKARTHACGRAPGRRRRCGLSPGRLAPGGALSRSRLEVGTAPVDRRDR